MAVQTVDPKAKFGQLLGRVIDTGEELWKNSAKNDAEGRQRAMKPFSSAVDRFAEVLPLVYAETAGTDRVYARAAAQMQAGTLLVAGGRAADGEPDYLREALDLLKVQEKEWDKKRVSLLFDAELLKPPPGSPTAEQALEVFKRRAKGTLENMVTEARDVVKVGIAKIGKVLPVCAEDLIKAAGSFISTGALPLIQAGVQRIITGIQMLAEFFQGHDVGESLKFIKEALDPEKDKSLDEVFAHLLSKAFGCDDTRDTIDGLQLKTLTQDEIQNAGARMSELSVRYVRLLKWARWVLTGISVAGVFLILSGAIAQIGLTAVTAAYAIVTLAAFIIGMEFAEYQMRILLETLEA